MIQKSDCWYCSGIDSSACPVCSVDQPASEHGGRLSEDEEHLASKDRGDDYFPRRSDCKQAAAPESLVGSSSLQLLVQAECCLKQGLSEEASEFTNRALRKLDINFDACANSRILKIRMHSDLKHGERELFCLGLAFSARCSLLSRAYETCIEEIKRFRSAYDFFTDSGDFDITKMVKHENEVLGNFSPSSICIRDLPTLQAAMQILVSCRHRVSNGWAPKLVISHTDKALVGIEPISSQFFYGLNFMHANLYATKCQAELELEMWDEATEDAKRALEFHATFKEASHLLECAENEDW